MAAFDPAAPVPKKWTPLVAATDGGDAASVAAFLRSGADANAAAAGEHPTISAKVWEGHTALILSARKGDAAIVKLLLAHPGIALNKTTKKGASAALVAATAGHAECLSALAAAGADLDAATSDGTTAAFMAASNGDVECVRRLADGGANLDAARGNGSTPVYAAAASGHHEAVALLVARGAKLEAKAKDGMTAAFVAASKNHLAVVEHLRDGGADLDAPNDNGCTPAYVARRVAAAAAAIVLHYRPTRPLPLS